MTDKNHDLERWRRVLGAPVASEKEQGPADSDRIWAAVNGELSSDELSELVAAALASPRGIEQWRLALELRRAAEEAGSEEPLQRAERSVKESPGPPGLSQSPPLTSASPVRGAAAAAAAWWADHRRLAASATLGLAMALLAATTLFRDSGNRGYRGDRAHPIRPLVETAHRDNFVLRWEVSQDLDPQSYAVVLTWKVETLARVPDLKREQLLVPEAALVDVPGGETLLWTVETTLADGSKISSSVFEVQLE